MLLLAAGLALVELLNGRDVELTKLVPVAGGGGLFLGLVCAAVLYVIRWRRPVEISPAGIDGFDLSGRNCFIRWNEIQSCSRFAEPALGLVCIVVRHSAPAWSPLKMPFALEDREAFVALVQRHAGNDAEIARQVSGQ